MKRILMPLCFATTPMLFAFFVLFLLPFSHSFSFAATNNMEKIRNEQARKQELKQAREQARKQILERIRRGAGTKPDRPRLDKRDGPRLDKQDDPRLNDPRLYDGPLDDSSGEFGNEFSGCGSGDVPGPISCADLASNPASVSGHGWQTVTNTLSEASCNLGHTDSVSGPGQLVLYDNTYTVMCANGLHEPGVYVGETPPDSNWGAYVSPSETCKMKTGRRPSDGTRVVEVIVCPVLSDEAPDEQAIDRTLIGAADIESAGTAYTRKDGEDAVEVASFTVHVGSVEDATFDSVTLYLDGDSQIISNPSLTRHAADVGSCEVSGDYIVCSDIDLLIERGESASFTLYADVDGESADSVTIYVEDTTDAAIVGDTYGYNLTLSVAEGDSPTDSYVEELDSSQQSNTVTLEAAGALTLTYNGPAAGDVSQDTRNVTLIYFSLTAEVEVNIGDAVVAVYGTGLLVTDVHDLDLACDGSLVDRIEGLTDTSGGGLDVVADVQTFGHQWVIEAGETRDCEVRIDIERGAVGTDIQAEIVALSTWDIRDMNNDRVTDIVPTGNILGNTQNITAAP